MSLMDTINALNFDCTAKYFVAYAALTKDMIDKKIITYDVKWGNVQNIKYDQAAFDKYFADLGIKPIDVAEMVRANQKIK